MTIPQQIYLDYLCALDYPEQEPAYISCTWWHVMILLIPIAGIVLFPEAVKWTYEKQKA
jgi:hypothetical protein